MSAGTVFTELDLDFSKFERNQQKLLQSAQEASTSVEKNWQNLAAKSDNIFAAMRASAENSFNMIAKADGTSKAEMTRATQAYNDKISSINNQQFGEHESLLSKLKTNWIAASAAIYAAWAVVQKAWNMAEAAASFNEQMNLLDGLAAKYGTTAQSIIKRVQEAGDGMIKMATAAEVSAAALAKGLDPTQITNMAKAASVLADVMGVKVDVAFKQFVNALETGRTRSITAAVGLQAMGNASDEMTGKMTAAEKAMQANNAIMAAMEKVVSQTGTATKSLADDMERLEVTVANLQIEMGQGMIRAGAGALALFQGLAAAVLFLASGVALAASGWALYTGNMALYKSAMENYNAAQGASAELTKKSTTNFGLMLATTEELTKATGGGGGGLAGAVDTQKQSETERLAVQKEVTTSMTALTKVMQDYGAEQIKIAGAAFGTALKAENVTVVEMTAALSTYTTALKTVYDARIAGEKAVAQAMKDSGAAMDPKTQLEAQAAILKSQKEYLTASLAGWQTYYDALASQHAKATASMATKEKELVALQKEGQALYKTYLDMNLGLQEKLLIVQGKTQNSEEVYNLKRNALEAAYSAAMALTGEAKIKALSDYMTKAAAMTDAVTSGNLTIKTSEEQIKLAMNNVNEAQDAIADEQRKLIAAKKDEIDVVGKWKGELETAMGNTKTQMIAYTKQITDLSDIMLKMDKEIAMTVSDKATGPLSSIKTLLDSIQSKSITVTVNQVSAGSAGGSGGGGGISSVTPSDSGGGGATWDDGQGIVMDGMGGMSDMGGGDTGGGMGGFDFAMGGAFNMGNITPFAGGGIFDKPTFFPMARGMGLMGEAGPEAVMPLTRGSDGKLGVKASGGGVSFLWTGNIIGGNKSPEQLAREIVKPLKEEMRRLQGVGG